MLGGEPAANLTLDSHVRYLSELLLAIGLSFWSTIPASNCEPHDLDFWPRMWLWWARTFGLLVEGPPTAMIFGLLMALGGNAPAPLVAGPGRGEQAAIRLTSGGHSLM
jgi:hypothetical protein